MTEQISYAWESAERVGAVDFGPKARTVTIEVRVHRADRAIFLVRRTRDNKAFCMSVFDWRARELGALFDQALRMFEE